jgi:uncharacterized protein YfdQ (DUF2303 family)
MIEPNESTNDVAVAADLGRRDAERALTAYTLDGESALLVSRLRVDEKVVVTDLEHHLDAPLRARGSVGVHDPGDFARYVQRIADPTHTSVWADIDRAAVTALLDDHGHVDQPGWRSHTVRLDLQGDPDWNAWLARDNKLFGQVSFAEFLEQQMHTVIQPAAADIYEVATTLQAKRNITYASSVRLKSGDVKFTFNEETAAKAGQKGELEIPDEFTLRLAPFAYATPVELTAKLRYRIEDGQLKIGYKLLRPLEIRRDAFSAIVGEIRGLLGEGLPVFLGSTPRLS